LTTAAVNCAVADWYSVSSPCSSRRFASASASVVARLFDLLLQREELLAQELDAPAEDLAALLPVIALARDDLLGLDPLAEHRARVVERSAGCVRPPPSLPS
jgi:hypothetical protein